MAKINFPTAIESVCIIHDAAHRVADNTIVSISGASLQIISPIGPHFSIHLFLQRSWSPPPPPPSPPLPPIYSYRTYINYSIGVYLILLARLPSKKQNTKQRQLSVYIEAYTLVWCCCCCCHSLLTTMLCFSIYCRCVYVFADATPCIVALSAIYIYIYISVVRRLYVMFYVCAFVYLFACVMYTQNDTIRLLHWPKTLQNLAQIVKYLSFVVVVVIVIVTFRSSTHFEVTCSRAIFHIVTKTNINVCPNMRMCGYELEYVAALFASCTPHLWTQNALFISFENVK